MFAEKWKGQLGSELQLMMARVSGCTPEVLPREAGGHVSGSWPLQGGLKGLGKLRFRSTPAAGWQGKGEAGGTHTTQMLRSKQLRASLMLVLCVRLHHACTAGRETPASSPLFARELAAKPSGFMVGIRNCSNNQGVCERQQC